MVRTTFEAIQSLTNIQKLQIIKEFEQFEKDGFIDDCLLRQTAKTLPYGHAHVVMYMNQIAMECYRYFANKLINKELY